MDKRLELTESQMRLLHRFNELCREMKNDGILFVYHHEGLFVMNGKEVDDYEFPEDISKEDGEVEVGFYDLPLTALDLFYEGGFLDGSFGIRFKTDGHEG